jgi:death-on-curing protein
MTWRWLHPSAILAMHDEQLVEHGGLPGIRDRNALESALARPRNQAAYGEPDHADLAAAYACGFARNHAFSDGNKRIAWIAANVFLGLNGYAVEFSDADAVRTVEAVAEGQISETNFAEWLRDRIVLLKK